MVINDCFESDFYEDYLSILSYFYKYIYFLCVLSILGNLHWLFGCICLKLRGCFTSLCLCLYCC